jgi:dTDP-4-dehydrorhamnose 3,5-epimerase
MIDLKALRAVQEFFISPENYMLVTVPPMIWNGFKGIGTQTAIVANCSTIPHSPGELERRPISDASIPYDWALEHR